MSNVYEGVAIGGELEGKIIKFHVPVYRHPCQNKMKLIYDPSNEPSIDDLPIDEYRFDFVRFNDEHYGLWIHEKISKDDVFNHILKQLGSWKRLIADARSTHWDIYEQVVRRLG